MFVTLTLEGLAIWTLVSFVCGVGVTAYIVMNTSKTAKPS